jgi:hypothetical protein
VFYASTLGFKNAPYLEFDGATPALEVGAMKSFINDDDGERINMLLGQAGSKILAVGNKALENSKLIADVAHEKITQIAESKAGKEDAKGEGVSNNPCPGCGQVVGPSNIFCGSCGTKIG